LNSHGKRISRFVQSGNGESNVVFNRHLYLVKLDAFEIQTCLDIYIPQFRTDD